MILLRTLNITRRIRLFSFVLAFSSLISVVRADADKPSAPTSKPSASTEESARPVDDKKTTGEKKPTEKQSKSSDEKKSSDKDKQPRPGNKLSKADKEKQAAKAKIRAAQSKAENFADTKTPGVVESSQPDYLPETRFHLTARPWTPIASPKSVQLDQIDKAIHALAKLQYWNAKDPKDVKNGAIIDPYAHKEVQYATPHFAYVVASLLEEGRASDLVEQGARALDRTTLDISLGKANDWHGEFFAAPMVKALRRFELLKEKYPKEITDERLATWKKRLAADRKSFMNMTVRQNWRTFAMEGEWLRQKDGYISDGVDWIEACWKDKAEGRQRNRFLEDRDVYGLDPFFFMYHDHGADPETFAYNGATTANLINMLEDGYDGPSAEEMRDVLKHTLSSAMFLMGGSGEAPAGGRTGEHIWNDAIYAAGFERMAEISASEGDLRLAGQFRHAAQLLMQSHARFQQESGLFSITKNQFNSGLKNRYASWSGLTNYGCFTISSLMEALQGQKTEIAERPAPCEIGGYVVQLDPSFSNVFADAGGMQAQICTRGETDAYGSVQWHAFGITRFSRTGFDSRLGPAGGHANPEFDDGVSFSPVYFLNGKWNRVCLDPKRFIGNFHTEFVHPLLVRGTFTVEPAPGRTGPTFKMQMTLTPDGVLVDTACESDAKTAEQFGVIWPVFEFDGRTVMNKTVSSRIASTSYPSMNGKPIVLQAKQAQHSGDASEWTGVEGGEGGSTAVGFSYALAGNAKAVRRMKLIVNGVVQPDLVFLSTLSADDRHQLYVPVTLVAGANNSVRLESIPVSDEKAKEVVIDELRVYPAAHSASEPDQENFIALKATHELDASAPAVRGGYGDFRPVRVTDSRRETVETFVYPRNAGDPTAEAVNDSFKREGQDFSSVLGRVQGTLYVGRTSAGGFGSAIDLDGDGMNDVTFDRNCSFILQLKHGNVTAIETDQTARVRINGMRLRLAPYTPVTLD